MRFILFTISLSVVVCFNTFAQKVQVSDTVQISYLYNVTILFEKPILEKPYFGSSVAVLWEKLDDRTLMVKVNGDKLREMKATTMPNTNMTVKTTDALYNFILTFKKEPNRTIISPSEYKPIHRYAVTQTAEIKPEKRSEEQKKQDVQQAVSTDTTNTKLLKQLDQEKIDFYSLAVIDNKFKMTVMVTNIWVDSKYIYFKIRVQNEGSIPYDIDYLRYTTSIGRISLKQTSDPGIPKQPVFQLTNPKNKVIKAHEVFTNIAVFDKFTVDKGQFFNIQIGEIQGSRQLTVPINRKDFFSAHNIDELKLLK
jgi:hypothetical protein